MADEEGAVAVAEAVTEPVVAPVEPGQPEAETTPEETLESVKAQLKVALEEKAQFEQRAKTVQGQLKGKQDADATLTGIRREMRSQNARIDAILKGQITGDPEVAQREWETAQQAHQAEDLRDAFTTQLSDLRETIAEDVDDAGLTMTSPELAEAQRIWEEGGRTQNLTLARTAAKMVRDIRRAIQTQEFEQREAAAKKANGSLRTPVPQASGNGNSGEQSLVNKLAKGEALSPTQIAQAQAAMSRGVYPSR